MTSTGWSGAALWWVELQGGERLVAKHVVADADWLSRATGAVAREGLFFADGIYARMPDAIDPAVVFAAADGDGWWVLSRDVSAVLFDADSIIPRDTSRVILAAADGMWKEFWGDRVPNASALTDRLHCAAPSLASVERDGTDLLPKQFEAAWAAFGAAVGDELGEAIVSWLRIPRRLSRRSTPAARRSSTATCATRTSASTATAWWRSTGASRHRAIRWSSSPGT